MTLPEMIWLAGIISAGIVSVVGWWPDASEE